MNEKIIIIGAGGHAKVVGDIVIKNNDTLLGFLDDNISTKTKIIGNYEVLGKIEDCIKISKHDATIKFIIAIGNNEIRERISKQYELQYYVAIHPTASIGIDVKINEGTVVMANAVINSNTYIDKHCIINTGAIVEHDNQIDNYVHICPNSTLSGTVNIGSKANIGVGSTVKNNINICPNAVIGAGAVVVKDIEKPGIYVGIPARILKKCK